MSSNLDYSDFPFDRTHSEQENGSKQREPLYGGIMF